MRKTVKLLMLILFLAQPGCARMLTEAIASSPNRLMPWGAEANELVIPHSALGVRTRFVVPVDGVEPAEIAVAILDPPRRIDEPRGTILVVHGIRAQGAWMLLGIGQSLADEGYRVALVDLRGHGSSTGQTLSYGVHEANDLAQVIDELQARGLVVGKLGVYGHSYGATTSILLAARDERVAAVVVSAPFADMRDEVPHYVRTMLPGLGHLLPDQFYDSVVDEVGRRGAFDPDDASAEKAIAHVRAPVLLLHGLDDLVVPPEHSYRIHVASRGNTELHYLRDTGHFGVWLDADGAVARRAVAWFDEHLAP